MKTIATAAFALACTACASLGVASHVVTGVESSARLTLGKADLWTTTPVKINRAAQSYERLPAVTSTYASSPVRITKATLLSAEKNNGLSMNASGKVAGLSGRHLDWCASRYRSFNADTNTYRSFGGEIRSCASPFANNQPDQFLDQAVQSSSISQQVAAWCARYKSYRIEDNAYQPHGGMRRPCRGPKSGEEIALAE
jgi:hypothetical protein